MKGKYFFISEIVPPTKGISNDQYWNGWSTPSFLKEDAIRILRLVNRFPLDEGDLLSENLYRYQEDEGKFYIDVYEEGKVVESEWIKPLVFDGKEWIDLGSFSWCWQEVESCPLDEELLSEMTTTYMIALEKKKEIVLSVQDSKLVIALENTVTEVSFIDSETAIDQMYKVKDWFEDVRLND